MLAACGGDGGGPIPIDELDDALVSTICGLYVTCGMIEDHQTCRMVFFEGDIDADLVAAVDAGKVIYHPDKARECLNGIGGSCERGSLNNNDESAACDETFEGTVGAGGQCAIDEECVSRTCNVPSCPDACCQGTCVGDTPPVRPSIGEACQPDGVSCTDSYCDTTTTTCVAYKPTGQPCAGSSECESGLCANQVCTALPGPGEPCSTQVSFGLCSELGYTCSTSSMTCVPYGLSGDPCTSANDCSPVYECSPSGTCELGATLGEPCGGVEQSECVDRSYCEQTTMTCTAPKADGMPCDSDRQCASDYCDGTTSTCATQPICI